MPENKELIEHMAMAARQEYWSGDPCIIPWANLPTEVMESWLKSQSAALRVLRTYEGTPGLTPDDAEHGCCQEASNLIPGTYLPCNKPAVKLVYHPRDDRAYRMCEMCADYNIRNRGGEDRGLLTQSGER